MSIPNKTEAWLIETYTTGILRPDQISWVEIYEKHTPQMTVNVYMLHGPNLYLIGEPAKAFLIWLQNYWQIRTVYEADNSGKQNTDSAGLHV